MFPGALICELARPSLQGSTASFDQEVPGITAEVVTIGWLEEGSLLARVGNRRGSRAMCFIKSRWQGVSPFFPFHASLGSSR